MVLLLKPWRIVTQHRNFPHLYRVSQCIFIISYVVFHRTSEILKIMEPSSGQNLSVKCQEKKRKDFFFFFWSYILFVLAAKRILYQVNNTCTAKTQHSQIQKCAIYLTDDWTFLLQCALNAACVLPLSGSSMKMATQKMSVSSTEQWFIVIPSSPSWP